jgi:hypothetical protein
MPIYRISAEHVRSLAELLRRPDASVGSEADRDRRFIDEVRARHPDWDRSQRTPEFIEGDKVPDRWIQVVLLRGVQIMLASQGHQVLMLGGLETPVIAVHRGLEPLAVRTIPPNVEILFAPKLSQDECEAISRSIDDGVSASLSIITEVAKDVPISGDAFAERVWRACRESNTARPPPPVRSIEDERRVSEYIALFHGQPRLQQLEMALALSERVLTGKDKPRDRQIQATAANQMWHELGTIDCAHIEPLAARRSGWQRVASLGIQEDFERRAFIDLVRTAMGGICQDDPVDVEVTNGATVRVYRFHAGQRTLIDRHGGRRGRVH